MNKDVQKTSGATSSQTFSVNPQPRQRIVPVLKSEPAKVERRTRRVAFKKADISRALTAATKGGMVPGSFEVTPAGNIRVYAAGSEPERTLFDQWADKL